MKKFKLGIDIHGVANEPKLKEMIALISFLMVSAGHEVHILSGPPEDIIRKEVEELGISFTHIFSVVDHNRSIGTPMFQDKDGFWWTDEDYHWDKTKADYCAKHGIDMHWDDSDRYGLFFTTPYFRVYTKDKRTSVGRKGKGA